MMENDSGSVDVVEVVEREENEREELPITHLGSEVVKGVAKKTEEVALAVVEDEEAEVPIHQPPDSVSATPLVVSISEPVARSVDPVQSEIGENLSSPGDAPPLHSEPPISKPEEGSNVNSLPSDAEESLGSHGDAPPPQSEPPFSMPEEGSSVNSLPSEAEESLGSPGDAPPPNSEPPISKPEEGSSVKSLPSEAEENLGSPTYAPSPPSEPQQGNILDSLPSEADETVVSSGDAPPPPSEFSISKTQQGGVYPVESETDQGVGTLGDTLPLPLPSEIPISNPPPGSASPTESEADESMGIPGDTPPTSSDHSISELHVEDRDSVQSEVHGDALPRPSGLPIMEPQPGTEDPLPMEADEDMGLPEEEQIEQLEFDEPYLLSTPISEELTQAYNVPFERIEKVVSGEDAAPNHRKEESPSVTDDPTSEQPDCGLKSHLGTDRHESKGITETQVARITHLEHRASWIGCCGLLDVISGANR